MKKYLVIITMLQLAFFVSCSQSSSGPGYNWSLFNNTINEQLAKAVAIQDTTSIFRLIKEKKGNINFQEERFGRSLLMLAVGNDLEKSTSALLKAGAKVDLRDSRDDQAIHEAVVSIDLKKHSLEILKLLVKYHANVNAVSTKGTNPVPLAGAVDNFECAKFLLENSANPYFMEDNSYPIWFNSLTADITDKIYVAHYMIIEKKMLVPKLVFNSKALHNPENAYDLLNKGDFSKEEKKQQARTEVIDYLHKIGYPNYNYYK